VAEFTAINVLAVAFAHVRVVMSVSLPAGSGFEMLVWVRMAVSKRYGRV
jgi:hypothetical protein